MAPPGGRPRVYSAHARVAPLAADTPLSGGKRPPWCFAAQGPWRCAAQGPWCCAAQGPLHTGTKGKTTPDKLALVSPCSAMCLRRMLGAASQGNYGSSRLGSRPCPTSRGNSRTSVRCWAYFTLGYVVGAPPPLGKSAVAPPLMENRRWLRP